MAASGEVYVGRWTDYSQPFPFGDTVTIPSREGNLLIAATSLFVTIVGFRLWTIITFVLHQVRSQEGEADGLFRQQQVLLRNSPGPFGMFLKFVQLGWAWRKTGSHGSRVARPQTRTLAIAIPALLYALVFVVFGVLSSRVASGSLVKIVNGHCGMFGNSTTPGANEASQMRYKNETEVAQAYARQCYRVGGARLGCGFYQVDSLPYTKFDDDCPFGNDINGLSMCTASALTMQTSLLDSDTHFGINTKPEDRVQYQKRATCVPLNISAYAEPHAQDPNTFNYFLGRYGGEQLGANDVTFAYNTSLFDAKAPLHLETREDSTGSSPGSIDSWSAINPLNVTDANTGLVFLMQNWVDWGTPVRDPWYSATTEVETGSIYGSSIYIADKWVSALGCTEKRRLCNPHNSRCSDFVPPAAIINESTWAGLDFNGAQNALSIRFFHDALYSTLVTQPFYLNTNALLASSKIIAGTTGSSLPDNQWQLEVESWFQIALSRLQAGMIGLATQDQALVNDPRNDFLDWREAMAGINEPFQLAVIDQCSQTRVHSTQDFQNFSFFGLMLEYSLGMIIVLISYLLEPLVEWKRRHWRMANGYREVARVEDRLLNLHARAYDNAGYEGWDDLNASVPVTPSGVRFSPFTKTARVGGYQAPYHNSDINPRVLSGSRGEESLIKSPGTEITFSTLNSPNQPYSPQQPRSTLTHTSWNSQRDNYTYQSLQSGRSS